MRFGFHIYHGSLRDRFSNHLRIYSLLILLFITSLLYFGWSTFGQTTQTIFARDQYLSPISDTYTEPSSSSISKKVSSLKMIGFLPYWSVTGNAHVYPEYLDQIIYFGLNIDAQGNIIKKDETGKFTTEWNGFVSPYFEKIREQAKKTNTKILICIKNFDNNDIESILTNPASSDNAIRQIKALIKEYDLDGVNIDFEYFSTEDIEIMTYHNRFFTKLGKELKTDNPGIILSADVNATVVYKDNAYDMVKIGNSIDQVIIMGYDYHWVESQNAGAVAPIEAGQDEPSIRTTLDSLKGRVTTDRIILGIPFYGYEWQTKTKEKNSETMPDTGATATYRRVRDLITHRTDIEFHYDEQAQSPWLVYTQNGDIKQIYYDDEASILQKLEFADQRKLYGVAIWALGHEGSYIEPWQVIKGYTKGN